MPNCGARALRASALALLALAAAPVFAADPYNSDRPGATDHRLLSRYQGSMLYMHGEDLAGSAQMLAEEKAS